METVWQWRQLSHQSVVGLCWGQRCVTTDRGLPGCCCWSVRQRRRTKTLTPKLVWHPLCWILMRRFFCPHTHTHALTHAARHLGTCIRSKISQHIQYMTAESRHDRFNLMGGQEQKLVVGLLTCGSSIISPDTKLAFAGCPGLDHSELNILGFLTVSQTKQHKIKMLHRACGSNDGHVPLFSDTLYSRRLIVLCIKESNCQIYW